MFGFLNINKPSGITSFDVIARLRKILNIKQIGHAGTLDPLAEGVLVVAVGKAARLLEFIDSDKTYVAGFQLGKTSTTYDIEGEIINQKISNENYENIAHNLKIFEGRIIQTPPIYSAIKVKGKKLYEYARKNENVEIPKREVFVKEIKLQEFNKETQEGILFIECSGGTYIRSIINDLGTKLDVGAIMTSLKRTKVGSFCIENSINLEEITKENLILPQNVLKFPQINLSENEYKIIKNGNFIKRDELKEAEEETALLLYENELISIAKIEETGKIKPIKVF